MTRTVGGSAQRDADSSSATINRRQIAARLGRKKQRVGAIPAAECCGSFSRRYRPGERALLEIRKFQKSGDLLLRRLPFTRLV
jgi:hypothetical protein